MPIITKEQAKSLVGITASTYDTQIAALIPVMQDWIVEYLNNKFLDNTVRMGSSNLTFVDDTPATITDSSSLFIENGDNKTYFYDGMDLEIHGTYRNDKIVEIDTVAAGTLTLASGETLVDEDAEDDNTYVLLTRINWPTGIQRPFARLLLFDLKMKNPALKSRSLADYTETYAGEGDYPPDLLKAFTSWKKMRWA